MLLSDEFLKGKKSAKSQHRRKTRGGLVLANIGTGLSDDEPEPNDVTFCNPKRKEKFGWGF